MGDNRSRRKLGLPAKGISLVRYLLPDVQPKTSRYHTDERRVEYCSRACRHSGGKPILGFELILIDNGSSAPAALDFLVDAHDPRVRVLRQDEEFNYSRLSNPACKRVVPNLSSDDNDVSVIE